MKKKIIAVILCLVMSVTALSLVSCTSNMAGNTETDTNGKTTTAETQKTETESSVIGEAESIIGHAARGMRNKMGDPHFSDFPHRGMTPDGK